MTPRLGPQPISIRKSALPRDHKTASIWAALDGVIDPELGVAITDLGLIYEVTVDNGSVHVVMTTTTPICPMGAFVRQQVVNALPEFEVSVDLVHQPLWRPEMMNDQAREQLGWTR